jgi:hypothetical protein
MRALSIIAFAVGAIGTALLGTVPVHAQEYPWCVQYGGGGNGGGVNCGFVTWDQCMATRSGNGGFCYNNPFYHEPYAQQRPNRPQRRDRDR